jgi:hypothetical protein
MLVKLLKGASQRITGKSDPKKEKVDPVLEDFLGKLAKNRMYLEKKLELFDLYIENQVERSKLQDDDSAQFAHYTESDLSSMQHYITNGIDYDTIPIDFVRDVLLSMEVKGPLTISPISVSISQSISTTDVSPTVPTIPALRLNVEQLSSGTLSDESAQSGESSREFEVEDTTGRILRSQSLSRRTTEELLQEVKKLDIHEILDSSNKRYQEAFINFVKKGFGTMSKTCIQFHQSYMDLKKNPTEKQCDLLIKEYGKTSVFSDYMSLTEEGEQPLQVCLALHEIVLEHLSNECLDAFLASSIYKKIASKVEESKDSNVDLSIYYVDEYKNKVLDLKSSDLEMVNGSDEVKCATVDKIIEITTSPDQNDYDNETLFTLMLTYRSFISPLELMEKLMIRYFTPVPKDVQDLNEWNKAVLQRIRLRVTKLIKYWLEKHHHDFKGELMDKLQDFIRNMKKSKGDIFSKTIEKIATNVKSGNLPDPWNPIEKVKCPPSILPKKGVEDVLEWNEKEFARQL